MKPILGVFAILSWLARCHGVEPPSGPHHHGHDRDGGQATSEDAGLDAGQSDGGADGGLLLTTRARCGRHGRPRARRRSDGDDAAWTEDDDAICHRGSTRSKRVVSRRLRGISRIQPKLEMWRDGATRALHVLPPGAARPSNPDRSFPVGLASTSVQRNGLKIGQRDDQEECPRASIAGLVSWMDRADRAPGGRRSSGGPAQRA